ncbi:hypothetical protein [Cereibacter johrii]|uniref:hypothetical protein n=1 Tax=Cereibacter johrii TaxID=445629 RepID=UPI000DCE6A5C|nr:hypothetical protein [Cereibacter johrii]RAZ87853.1 hypothetical protein DDV93_01460 [Cereibacter johrii]
MQTDKNMTGSGTASDPSGRPGFTDAARETARREMDDARERLHGAAGRAREEAHRARSSVSRLVLDEMDRRKEDLCDSIHGIAQSMRKGAEEAEKRDDAPAPPQMIHRAIHTLDDMADRMRHRSAEEMTRSVARFGRENPALFVGGALFAGLAIGRFLVSSSSNRPGRRDWDEGDAMRDDRWRGAAPGSSAHERASHEPLGAKPHDIGGQNRPSTAGQPGAAPFSAPGGAAMPGTEPTQPGRANEATARSSGMAPTAASVKPLGSGPTSGGKDGGS